MLTHTHTHAYTHTHKHTHTHTKVQRSLWVYGVTSVNNAEQNVGKKHNFQQRMSIEYFTYCFSIPSVCIDPSGDTQTQCVWSRLAKKILTMMHPLNIMYTSHYTNLYRQQCNVQDGQSKAICYRIFFFLAFQGLSSTKHWQTIEKGHLQVKVIIYKTEKKIGCFSGLDIHRGKDLHPSSL